jgi:hypothetical protein
VKDTARPGSAHTDLLLTSQYPAYFFTSVPRVDGWSYTAQAKRLGTRPWCVVTSDVADFRRELGEPRRTGA